jgi:hypothetical protein
VTSGGRHEARHCGTLDGNSLLRLHRQAANQTTAGGAPTKVAWLPCHGGTPVAPRLWEGSPWMRLVIAHLLMALASLTDAPLRRIDDGQRRRPFLLASSQGGGAVQERAKQGRGGV